MKVKIYLSGHLKNKWRDRVKEMSKSGNIEFLEPIRANTTHPDYYYGSRDRLLIQKSDIVFAYIQDSPDNPDARYFGLGVEVGYARALGKIIILVNEFGDKIISFEFARSFADNCVTTLEEGVDILDFCTKNIENK